MRNSVLAVVFGVLVTAGAIPAGEKLQAENAALRARVDKLEGQLEEIKDLLVKQNEEVKLLRDNYRDQPHAPVQTGQPQGKLRLPVLSDHESGLYGYVKFDAAHQSHHALADNLVFYARSEELNEDDDEFIATANQTRIGLSLNGPEVGEWTTGGRLEVDFYGGGAENSAQPRMRHAYVQATQKEWDFSILAGQTWDIFSPLVPPTLNFAVGGDAGSLGLRRPQLRAEKGFGIGDESRLLLQAGFSRTIGEDDGIAPNDTGEDAGFPTFQGRIAFTTPIAGRKATVGLSGHWGEEEYDVAQDGEHKNFDTWSANIDLNLPLTAWLTLQGEAFTGTNLDTYFGGIGQGVNRTDLNEIDAYGGWLALMASPWAKWHFATGAGFDNPDDGDLAGNARTLNTFAFINAIYDFHEDLSAGVEVSKWWTEYENVQDGETLRLQFSVTYDF